VEKPDLRLMLDSMAAMWYACWWPVWSIPVVS